LNYNRLKITGILALVGFVTGSIAYFGYKYAVPGLLLSFPQMVESGWILWGVGGSVLAVVLCAVYAVFPER